MKAILTLALVGSLCSAVVGASAAAVVQNFTALPSGTCGDYADNQGSTLAMKLGKGPVAIFNYALRQGGWCGEWLRAGNDWNGQNWSRAAGLEAVVFSKEPLSLQFQFNDANDNAYLSPAIPVAAGVWTTVDAGFTSFGLNSYYQPPHAKKGFPLDLTMVKTFNIDPLTPGQHSFQVRQITLE